MFDQDNTIKLELTKGFYALVDADCPDWIKKQKWCSTKSGTSEKVYAACSGRQHNHSGLLLLHRVIIGAQKGQMVDHINGDTLDNRRSNLRFCNHSQNGANSIPKRGLEFKGVTLDKRRNKWTARIVLNYKKVYLGEFDDKIDAAKAYDKAAKKHFGEFCKLNFVNSD